MLVMPANWSGARCHYLAGKYAGQIGHLYSPGGQRGPFPWLPYALDNGAYSAFTNNIEFDVDAWLDLLAWAKNSDQQPMWCLIPDKVGDKDETLQMWYRWSPYVREKYGWPIAFAGQDGMSWKDIPDDANVVFIGGSTEWKRSVIRQWCGLFRRVHVGRINSLKYLKICADSGAESVDGTGWGRFADVMIPRLESFFAYHASQVKQPNLFGGQNAP